MEENKNELQDSKVVTPKTPDENFMKIMDKEISSNGGELKIDPRFEGSVGRNMFDLPNSKDNLVSVLIPLEDIQKIPIQSLVRIKSLQDERTYQGIVVGGPFYEPD